MKAGQEKSKKITVVGGGASGMIAAIFAAREIGGQHIRLIEKNEKLGRKLLATGNGRCNISNAFCEEFQPFGNEVFQKMNTEKTLEFFKSIGVLTREESEGRLYPYSEQAQSVQQALLEELESLNIDIWYQSSVSSIERVDTGFRINVETRQEENTNKGKKHVRQDQYCLFSEAVIVATGGKAGPQFGCTGDGFQIAKGFGHHINKLIPSLTQITSESYYFNELKGVRAKGRTTLYRKLEKLDEESGEIQFTESGLSGICIFNLSKLIRLGAYQYSDYAVELDLMPEYTQQEVFDLLVERSISIGNRKVAMFLNGIIHNKLAPIVLREAGMKPEDMHKDICAMTKQQIKVIVKILKCWHITVSGTKGWKEAQVTSGGIDFTELDVNTLESKRIPNLFFVGEVTDVDGKCGGFNLQWAWSSGAVAGYEASKRIMC